MDEPPNKYEMYGAKMEESRRFTTFGANQSAAITNEVDCDELEDIMRSTSDVVGNAPAIEEYFEDDLYIEESHIANPSGNHAAVETVGKYFEDELFMEKSRTANPSGNHAVETVGKYFEDDLFIEKSRIANPSGNHATTGGGPGGKAPVLDPILKRSSTPSQMKCTTGKTSSVSSTLLREKQQIAYPRLVDRKGQTTNKIAQSAAITNEADCDELEEKMSATSGVVGTDPVEEHFEDDLYVEKSRRTNPSGKHAVEIEHDLFSKTRPMENPSYISYLDEHPASKENPSYISYLDEDPPSSEKPSYISYLEERPPSNSLLAVDHEPMPMPAQPSIGVVPQHRPGAHSYNAEASGANLQRLDQPRFSLIGLEHANDHEEDNSVDSDEENIDFRNRYDYEDGTNVQSDNDGTAEAGVPTNAVLPRPSNTDLAVATAIEYDSSVLLMEAQEIDPEVARKQAEDRKRKEQGMVGCTIIAICSIILGLILGLSIGRKERAPSNNLQTMDSAYGVGRSTPPLENLELLYDELPNKTKESLFSRNSPQYKAWEWVLNHPNITNYPEWRKKQVFALAAFYYSFEGPNWPEAKRKQWMDVETSECSWISNKFETTFFYQASFATVGPDAYTEEDWQTCNENGELQTLILHQLTNLSPSIPPEIGFLTSLKLIGIAFNLINARLLDLLVPELIQLPNLEGFTLRDNGVFGTIPKEIGLMTGLRHLLISANALTGTIPSEIGGMTSLEYLNVGDEESLSGELPSELGLMTKLTGLEIYRCSATGTIPTQLGWLSKTRKLYLGGNLLTAEIPSEFGLMTNVDRLWLGNNDLNGAIPSQLGKMSNLVELWLGNELLYTGPHANFTGSFPLELWKLSHMEELFLANLPNLHGNVPAEIMMPNLTLLSLGGSPQISGTIPDQVCLFVEELDFDCGDLLCGCGCHCANSGNGTNPNV